MPPRIIPLNIDVAKLDATNLLKEWRWLVPNDYKPIQMSKFGDWFFLAPNGHVFFLDLIEGNLTDIASSVPEYNRLKDTQDKQTEWFLDGLVFRCDSEGLLLHENECYGWKIPPAIGGKMVFENIQVYSLPVYQSVMGQVMRQLHKLKPGEPIPQIKIVQ